MAKRYQCFELLDRSRLRAAASMIPMRPSFGFTGGFDRR